MSVTDVFVVHAKSLAASHVSSQSLFWLLPLDELLASCVLQGVHAGSLHAASVSWEVEASSGLLS